MSLLQLASKIPMTIIKFRIVMKDFDKNVAVLEMHGPARECYTEVRVRNADTPLERLGVGGSVSLEFCLKLRLGVSC